MRVLIIGDVHGRLGVFAKCLQRAVEEHAVSVAIQVGDLGFFADVLAAFRASGGRFAVPVHAIDGNHEDHAWLSARVDDGTAENWREQFNLIYQPRGSMVTLGASRIGFLGGALHVDRPQEHAHGAAFPNYLRPEDRERALASFNHECPDLIVTHSCPCRIGVGVKGSPAFDPWVRLFVTNAGFDSGPRDDCGEVELTALWHGLRSGPRAWVFGHFHHPHHREVEATRFVCLSDELETPERSMAIWDTETKDLRPLQGGFHGSV